MEAYNEQGQLTAKGLAEWADQEGTDYLFASHGVDIDEMEPAIRAEASELERLYVAADSAWREFLRKHGL